VNHVLLWLSGVVVGAAVAWVIARRGESGVADGPVRARPAEPPTLPGLEAPVEPRLEDLLRALVDEAARRVDLWCGVALREKPGGPIRIRVVASGGDQRFVGLEVDVQSFLGRIVTEGMPLAEAATRVPVALDRRDRRRRPSGGVGVPLAAGERVFGALFTFGDPPLGASESVARLDPLAKSYATLLLSVLETDVARQSAETDPLTELLNRRGFDRALARASRGPVALIALDIDHFKKVNDTLGHVAGDTALRHLSRVLREGLRDGDLAARVGGEEFMVILPGGDLQLGLEVAERLRAQVESRPFHAEGGERRLTLSCGVAAFPRPVASADNLVKLADAALYQAKREGRNRVLATRPTGVPDGVRPVAKPEPSA
jgi:diguanylate cyclase (GGDEF)-like protein